MQANKSPGLICLKRQSKAFCPGRGQAGDFLFKNLIKVYYNVRHEKECRSNDQETKKRIRLEPSSLGAGYGLQQTLYSESRNRTNQESRYSGGEENIPCPRAEAGPDMIVYDSLHNNPYATQISRISSIFNQFHFRGLA